MLNAVLFFLCAVNQKWPSGTHEMVWSLEIEATCTWPTWVLAVASRHQQLLRVDCGGHQRVRRLWA